MTINNNNIFGAFTLNEARGSRLTGDWLNKESVANYGWFGGGVNITAPTIKSSVDRIDFSNDTIATSPRGPLNLSRAALAATGNSNYGWFGGGTPGAASSVERIDYSNDSAMPSSKGSLSERINSAATGNSNYGWFGGGNGLVSSVDRIDFSNDSSRASVRGPLSLSRAALAATGNSNYGWFGGGAIPAATSVVDRIDFANDSSVTSPRSPLSLARYWMGSTGNSNYGWFGGGTIPFPGPLSLSTVDRIDFSNDLSTASVRSSLLISRDRLSATGNSNYGWFGGGVLTTSISNTVERIDFSNDSISASHRSSGLLSLERYQLAATSGVLNIRIGKTGGYGWWGGSFDTTVPGRVSTVDRIDFSNDSVTLSRRGPLSSVRSSAASTGNSNYGWFAGGYPGSVGTVIVDRIDFSNDSATASVRGPLSSAKYNHAATGNSNYGWFGGGIIQPSPGLPPVHLSSTNRIDFSNDSATVSVRGSLNAPGGKSSMGATGNSNYGWFGGGFTNTPTPATFATVERIDFSNDSATPSPRGSLSSARSSLTATGNSNYGWFGGGSATATVDRIDFSNDSATASPRGPLSLARTQLAATGNSNYGWYAGGSSGGAPFASYNRVDRIDFSNDSVTASIRGSLSSTRYIRAATSNTTVS